MTVYILTQDMQHQCDYSEPANTVVGVYATEAAARAVERTMADANEAAGEVVYERDDDNSDWDYSYAVRAWEVES